MYVCVCIIIMHSISLAYCTGEPDPVSGYNSQMVECRYMLHVFGSLGSLLQFYQFLQELWEGEKKESADGGEG